MSALMPTCAMPIRVPPASTERVAALSGDRILLDRLADSSPPVRVHSVFDRAVNLVVGRRDAPGEDRPAGSSSVTDLITLVAESFDDAPGTVRVGVGSFRSAVVEVGAVGEVRASWLVLPTLRVRLDAATRWEPELPRLRPTSTALRVLEEVLRDDVRLPRPGADPYALLPVFRRLHAALGADDPRAVEEAGARLIGRGGGLTPAGDDHLVGLSAALAAPGAEPRDEWARDTSALLRRVVDEHGHRTTDIARAALHHATRGRVPASLSAVMEAMNGDDIRAVRWRAARVLALGHSSGADILLGLLAGVLIRKRGTLQT